jgi:ApaG protein
MSTAVSEGVRVEVASRYVPEESSPAGERYFFAYTVHISNEGRRTVQLRSRHWIITDARGRIEHVRGAGVVGQQPVLAPGESFEYTSACPLATPYGTMHGSYQMVREDGSGFEAEIAPFELVGPTDRVTRVLN